MSSNDHPFPDILDNLIITESSKNTGRNTAIHILKYAIEHSLVIDRLALEKLAWHDPIATSQFIKEFLNENNVHFVVKWLDDENFLEENPILLKNLAISSIVNLFSGSSCIDSVLRSFTRSIAGNMRSCL